MLYRVLLLTMAALLANGAIAAPVPNDNLTGAFARSYTSEAQRDYIKAIAELNSAYSPKSYECNLRLGWLCYLAKRYTESLSHYQKAIELQPKAIEPRLGYVLPANALGRTSDLTAQYEKILEVDPNNSLVNYRLGLICYNKKDYSSAYKHLERVVNLYPFDYSSLLLCAWCNYRLGKSREAEVLFKKVLLASPQDRSALEGLGLLK
jgi:tetratricopeptide (TPR) repeat protein